MRIAEIFYSIQGEGRLLGMPSVFIRTSGCNLRCVWCDTPYTSWNPGGREWTLDRVVEEATRYPTRHVVITGGEPLLARDIEALTETLKKRDHHITIETAATVYKPVTCDLLSMSPKLANSTPWKRQKGKFARMHEERRLNFSVIQKFVDRNDYQFKFVVENERDFDEIRGVLQNINNLDPARVLVMAQGKTKKELQDRRRWIVELCKNYGFAYTPRLQIELFGNRRGT